MRLSGSNLYIGVFNKALEYDNLVGGGFCEKFFLQKKKKKNAEEITESAQAVHTYYAKLVHVYLQ